MNMKRILITGLLLAAAAVAEAQPKIGLVFGPSISTNRFKFKANNGDITNDGSALRFKFGLEVDMPISDSYVFSTGLIYAPKRAGFTVESIGNTAQEDYKLQYLQLPLTLKLYTNEIQPDIKAYFQLGFLAEVKIFSEPFEDDYVLIEDFKLYDTSFVFGAGVEYGAGLSSLLYGGIFYNRGLINVVDEANITDDLAARLDMFTLQVGLKF